VSYFFHGKSYAFVVAKNGLGHNLGDFGRFWAILGDFGRFWAILGDFGRFWAIFSQIHLVTLCVDLRKKTIPILP
jgi:hypothetical protein